MSRILVCDDDKDIVELLRFLLEQAGHTVFEANDGHQGFTIALAEIPDLIVMDVMMPDWDGYRANQELLANAKTSSIPVIILTAKGQAHDLFQDAPNVRFYMEKPFESKQFRQNIAACLAVHQ